MKLSKYQEEILSAAEKKILALNNGDSAKGMLIEALAGTGKSFILVEICRSILKENGVDPEQVKLVVFGRKNKADLQAKLGNNVGSEWVESACTLNSLAFRILKEATGVGNQLWKIEANKYQKIAQEFGYLSRYEFRRGKREFLAGSLFADLDGEISETTLELEFQDLLEKFRLYCLPTSSKNFQYLISTYQMEMQHIAHAGSTQEKTILKALNKIFQEGYRKAFIGYWIDFVDQAWILWAGLMNFYHSGTDKEDNFAPTFANWSKELKFIAVDEAQDTDLLQINLLSKLINPQHNFLVAVGDRRQAVYSFRGCVADGMDKFKETFNCEQFLLPINYRCGKSHLRLVREIFPDIPIEPAPDAIEGEIKVLKWDNFMSLFADRSLSYIGVCRRNAPLITTALQLLAQSLPVKIKDSSLAKKIRAEVEKICKKLKFNYSEGWQAFPALLSEYEAKERERLLAYDDGEQRLEMLNDLLAAILALYEAYEPHTIAEWESSINRIFDESEGKAIDLYSIHSGKGGEADIAFIINAENMPLIHKKQTEEERKQENNLLYVALTRGKKTLAIISDEPTKISWLPKKYLETQQEEQAVAEVTHEPLEDDEIETLQELEAAEDNSAPEISAEEFMELLAKLQALPRPRLRTAMREMVDALGKEAIEELLS